MMFKIAVTFVIYFLFCSFDSFAQQQAESLQKTTVTKGYYAISNETEKVNSKSLNIKHGNPPKVTKGYYSIGDHHQKLPKPITVVVTTTPKPVVTKGYYQIGTDSLHHKSPD